MKTTARIASLSALVAAIATQNVTAGQVPGPAVQPDIPISHADRVYTAEQFSNTVSVIDPADNRLLGTIRLGDPQPGDLSPLYRGQILVHGLGFSPDHHTLAAVSILSNSVTFIDTSTNVIKHVTYVGRSPHEAFFTPNGNEVWVTVRGQNYIAVLDGHTYEEKSRITLPNGPGMTIFSPDGKYGYVCSSFTAEVDVFDVASHQAIGKVAQASPFCPDIAASPDGDQVWFTLKDSGKVQVFSAAKPFALITTIDTGAITNHLNFVHGEAGTFAYVTVGGSNAVKVFDTRNFKQVAEIPVGTLPHGIWPSGDGKRMYVGLENDDAVTVIDTSRQAVIATVPVGQAPQALVYVPGAVASGSGLQNLQPLGVAGQAAQFLLGATTGDTAAKTHVTLFDQGLTQVLQAAVTGLAPGHAYVLGLAEKPDGSGALQPFARFKTNVAGAAIVNAFGPVRQIVKGEQANPRRYLVIVDDDPSATAGHAHPLQIQL